MSNVGSNATMLTQSGELTDVGSWYLEGSKLVRYQTEMQDA